MNVPHLSAYCLTVEKKTALNNWVKKGRIEVGSEDDQSDQFIRLLEIMEENGYEQYEISNFCKSGFESQHNSNYWKGEWYVGVGPSAHAFNGISRSWNIANNQQYIKAISAGEEHFEIEVLSRKDQFNEAVLTGLRTSYGVQLKKLDSALAESEEFVRKYRQFIDCGWILKRGEILALSKEGKLRADHIASELFVGNG